ncbi:hypothetical protein V6K52_12630 [Knoellia sp. S7-12]|uniref:hypothetical protein n=1 Tax=Knoellia sp. S7-12 TaxID=3126698 RepID=UPI0033660BBD
MKKFVLVATAVAALAAPVVAAPQAFATDGKAQAHVTTPGKTDNSGGTASAVLDFTGDRTVYYKDWYVNDTCDSNGDGDGLGTWARAIAKYRDGSYGYGSWHKDTRGCGPAGLGFADGQFTASKDIMSAGVQVCLYDSSTQIRCASDMRDNGNT